MSPERPLAVALTWRRDADADEADEGGAPRGTAKGEGAFAERILRVAFDRGVKVRTDADLARTLHAAVEIGADIPPATYQAVAEIIGRVMRLRRGM